MALKLVNLDANTRKHMADEFGADVAAGKLYLSPRLSGIGRNDYPGFLKEAIQASDDAWLATQIANNGRLNQMEERRGKNGVTMAKVPITANQTMAEGEFNRFYARGLAALAIAAGIAELVVYRARASENPRAESEAKIGTRISAQALLDDLRQNIGVDTALGLPPGPNSGLSVKLP